MEFWFWGFGSFLKVFADAAQVRADPEDWRLRLVNPKEGGLAGERGDELEELRARKLEKGRWLRCGAPALEEGERGEKFGGRGDVGAELNLDGDCIAGRGTGEIRREEETEHGVQRVSLGVSWRGQKSWSLQSPGINCAADALIQVGA